MCCLLTIFVCTAEYLKKKEGEKMVIVIVVVIGTFYYVLLQFVKNTTGCLMSVLQGRLENNHF